MSDKKLVVITGASSGIGAATAKAFSDAGYPLLLLARRLDRMQSLNLPNAIIKAVDVLDVDSMRNAIAEAQDLHGEVDCLINNAGIMINGKPQSQTPDDWGYFSSVTLF